MPGPFRPQPVVQASFRVGDEISDAVYRFAGHPEVLCLSGLRFAEFGAEGGGRDRGGQRHPTKLRRRAMLSVLCALKLLLLLLLLLLLPTLLLSFLFITVALAADA